MPSNWICSDPDCYQYVRKIEDGTFELIELRFNGHHVARGTVNVKTYMDENKEQFETILYSFGYDNMQSIEEEYGDHAMQIAAECIFESDINPGSLRSFSSKQEAVAYIKSIVKPDDLDDSDTDNDLDNSDSDNDLYALLMYEYADACVNATVQHYRGLRAAQKAMQKAYEMSKDAWDVPEAGEEDEDHCIRRNDMSIHIRDDCDEIHWEIIKVNVEE